jgi:hypothetical protein
MMGSMTLTFLATKAASCGAYIQHPTSYLLVRPGAPSGNSAGDVADVGTIQIQTDTLRQIVNIVFSQTCICTGRTYLGARVAQLYASDQGIVGPSSNVRVSGDHLLGLHVALLYQGPMFGRKTKRLHSVPDWVLEGAAEMETFTHKVLVPAPLMSLVGWDPLRFNPLPSGGGRD